MDDTTLVQKAKGGDFDAFERLVAGHEQRLYALAWHITRNHHDAQDAVQNSLLAVVEKLDDFREESSFKTWVTRVAVNQALKLLRRHRGQKTHDFAENAGDGEFFSPPAFIADWRDDPQVKLDQRELRQVLDEGVGQLPEGQRLVFVLRDMEDMSVAETAETLAISASNVKVRLLRARLTLREYLTRRFGDESTRREPDHQGHDHDALLEKLTTNRNQSSADGAER